MARTALVLSANCESLKSPSAPNVTSDMRKNRVLSSPYFSTSSNGSITLPRDLDIFSPSFIHQPCAKMDFGRGRPAAMSMAGQ